MARITGYQPLTAVLNGDTVGGGGVMTVGGFSQRKNVTTGRYTPDYTKPAEQVLFYPIAQGSFGTVTDGTKLTKKRWYFNDVLVYDQDNPSVTLPAYLQIGTFNGLPSLKIIDNPASVVQNMAQGSKKIRFVCEIMTGATPVTLDIGGAEWIYSEAIDNAPKVTLITDNGGIVDANGTKCKLTAVVDIGESSAARTFYYTFTNSAGQVIAPMVGAGNENKIQVDDTMVTGSDYFKVEVYSDAAKTQFLASDVQHVFDTSDPLMIVTTAVAFTNQIITQDIKAKMMRGMVNESSKFKMFGPTQTSKDGYYRMVKADGVIYKQLPYTASATGGGTGDDAYFAKLTVTLDEYKEAAASGGCGLSISTLDS